MDSRQEKRSLFLLARSSGLSREDHGVSFLSLSSLSLYLFLYLVLLFQLSLTLSISPFLRIHADLSMTREIKIPKKDEREGGEKGIEGELLTTVGDSWQIPEMLVEITFDRLIIRKKDEFHGKKEIYPTTPK